MIFYKFLYPEGIEIKNKINNIYFFQITNKYTYKKKKSKSMIKSFFYFKQMLCEMLNKNFNRRFNVKIIDKISNFLRLLFIYLFSYHDFILI